MPRLATLLERPEHPTVLEQTFWDEFRGTRKSNPGCNLFRKLSGHTEKSKSSSNVIKKYSLQKPGTLVEYFRKDICLFRVPRSFLTTNTFGILFWIPQKTTKTCVRLFLVFAPLSTIWPNWATIMEHYEKVPLRTDEVPNGH